MADRVIGGQRVRARPRLRATAQEHGWEISDGMSVDTYRKGERHIVVAFTSADDVSIAEIQQGAGNPYTRMHGRARAGRIAEMLELTERFEVRRDGKTQASFETGDQREGSNWAFEWIMDHQGQSISWAVQYEGWSVVHVLADGTEIPVLPS